MEIWDERVRLQDARQRTARLAKAFEPTRLAPRAATPRARRHRHLPAPRFHWPVHLAH
jgi:hypothetical protein